MIGLATDSRVQALSRIGLCVLGGIVFYTGARVALSAVGVTGWAVTLGALAFALLFLEALTHIGWLTPPVPDEDG